MRNTNIEIEQPKVPFTLRLGDSFDLPLAGMSIYLGRATKSEFESKAVAEARDRGHLVYQVEALAGNAVVPKFAVELSCKQSGNIVVARPDSDFYLTSSDLSGKITVVDIEDKKFDVDSGNSHNIKVFDLVRIYVGDENVKNGFMLAMDGNNRMKLTGIIDNKVETKV